MHLTEGKLIDLREVHIIAVIKNQKKKVIRNIWCHLQKLLALIPGKKEKMESVIGPGYK